MIGSLLVGMTLAFLAGSIPFGFLVAKLKGMDIREHGSGNIGATNVGRVLGRYWGLTVYLLDSIKGAGAVLIYIHLIRAGAAVGSYEEILVGVSAVLGHNYCPWLGWKGGKGVATTGGVLLVILPEAFAWCMGAWVLVFCVSGYVSLASVFCAATLIVSGILYYGWSLKTLACLFLGGVAIVRHRSNIARLREGTESRLLWNKKSDKS